MNILFCHRSYPAQLGRLAARLADRGHCITFAAEQFSHQQCPWPDGWLLKLPPPDLVDRTGGEPLLHEWSLAVQRSRRIEQLLNQLKAVHRSPDLVIYQAGIGFGLLLRPLLSKLPIIAYAEWFFRRELLHWLVPNPSDSDFSLLSPRNAILVQELIDADRIVSPTRWQREQFPLVMRDRIEVIFDGIDTQFFSPQPVWDSLQLPNEGGGEVVIQRRHKLLTYATRGMEPIRGFPEFIAALPSLMNALPDLQVVVAGRDRHAYSYPSPDNHGSWKKTCLQPFLGASWLDRLHFTGLLPYVHYRQLLRRSDLHCSFSRPYVPSWSLMEAAACGTPLALNDGPASLGILPQAAQCVVDLDAPTSLVRGLTQALLMPQRPELRQNQLPSQYWLQSCLDRWDDLLNPWLNGG